MATFPIVNALAKNWWVLLIRGILAILFGVLWAAWTALRASADGRLEAAVQ